MQYRLQARYRRAVTKQYLRLPLSWHQRHPTGQLLSNANADVEAMWFPIAPLPMAVGVLVMLFVAGVALVLTDPVLSLVGFTIFPAIFVLNVVYQRRLSPLATRAQQLRAEVSGVAHESFDGALVVKTLGREPEETDAVPGRGRTSCGTRRCGSARCAASSTRSLEALPNLGVLAVLLVGAHPGRAGDDQRRRAGAGRLPVHPAGLPGARHRLGAGRAAPLGRRLGPGVARARGDAAGWRTAPWTWRTSPAPASLDVQGVDFGYGDAPVLHDVTFSVDAGRTVAVVGPTGSGKSTLTTLLVRLVDPASGEVVLDGVDLRAVARGGVAGAAAVVPQQTFLFDDTVRGNVTLGLDVPDSEVRRALVVAQADRFVDALPDGLDTRIGERGMTLSGGQRQRLALARALVRIAAAARHGRRDVVGRRAGRGGDPRRAAVDRHGAGAAPTVVVVAYRKATISLADEVVYVEHGRVLDRGTHPELLARCPGYRRLITAYEREDAERAALAADEEASEPVRLRPSGPATPAGRLGGLSGPARHQGAAPVDSRSAAAGCPDMLPGHARADGDGAASRVCSSSWASPSSSCSGRPRARHDRLAQPDADRVAASPTPSTPEPQIEAAVRNYYAELTRAAQTKDTTELATISHQAAARATSRPGDQQEPRRLEHNSRRRMVR